MEEFYNFEYEDTCHIGEGCICAFALKGRHLKLVEMIDVQFTEKDMITRVDILLALEDKILFNV